MDKEIIYCIPDAVLDGERIRGYIRNVVYKSFESGIKMSSCRIESSMMMQKRRNITIV